ncbi:MAG: 3-isopropylmalate dehydrogenase [Pseudomonadota bacterium]|nr:3-isopropylmalate dehydrogenase [Pseudomonadota bacterium]
MTHKILILPGDGIGPEISEAAVKILECLQDVAGFKFETELGLIGGAAFEDSGNPLPDSTIDLAKSANGVLFGAVGGPDWDKLDRNLRPESGLLRFRSELDLFCNLRPVTLFPALSESSTLKSHLISGLDVMIIRELTGGIYFGEPRGIEVKEDGVRVGYNTLVYDENEISRIAKAALKVASKRDCKLCSVDKANVLEVSELWREVVSKEARSFPQITLEHMYVDNAAMQLVRAPKQFDVIVTGNMFGDILSDLGAMLTGSIGMLPSASLDSGNFGLYEPVHGSAPDIANRNVANPLAMILSVEMLLRYSLSEKTLADSIKTAVDAVLTAGFRTKDIASKGSKVLGTNEMAVEVCKKLENVYDGKT